MNKTFVFKHAEKLIPVKESLEKHPHLFINPDNDSILVYEVDRTRAFIHLFEEYVNPPSRKALFDPLYYPTYEPLNGWLIEHVDLSDLNFGWRDFSGIVFSFCDFQNTKIDGSVLRNCSFHHCRFEDTRIDVCDFRGSSFSNCEILIDDPLGANFNDTEFQNCQLFLGTDDYHSENMRILNTGLLKPLPKEQKTEYDFEKLS